MAFPARLLGLAGAAALAGYAAYTALNRNGRQPLPPPLDGDRRSFISPQAGTVTWYADDSIAGRAVLLVHSVNAAASAMEVKPLWDRLRGQRPVHAIDLPGFGLSERGDVAYSPDLYADALIEWGEAIGLAVPADVVAMSLSCEFVAIAARKRPDLFRSIAMLSPTGFDAGATAPPHFPRLPFEAAEQVFFNAVASKPSIQYFLRKSFVGAVDSRLADYAWLTAHQPGARFAPMRFLTGELFTPKIRHEVYCHLTLPILIIHDQDPYVGFAGLDEVRGLPNFFIERIEPTRGLPHWDRPGETLTALEDFWRR